MHLLARLIRRVAFLREKNERTKKGGMKEGRREGGK
jgi:hypothetical protein